MGMGMGMGMGIASGARLRSQLGYSELEIV